MKTNRPRYNAQVSTYLTEEQKEVLTEFCDANVTTPTQLVRVLVINFLKDIK